MEHIERMREELKELSDKRLKGLEFLERAKKFPMQEPILDDTQRLLLEKQLDIMADYINILKQRISYDATKI